jgi:hypothetical protein
MKASKETNQKVMRMLWSIVDCDDKNLAQATLDQAVDLMKADMLAQLDGMGGTWPEYAAQCAKDEVADMDMTLQQMFDGGAIDGSFLKFHQRSRCKTRKAAKKSLK